MLNNFKKCRITSTVCLNCRNETSFEVNIPPPPSEDLALRAGHTPSASEALAVKASIQETEDSLKRIRRDQMSLNTMMKRLSDLGSAFEATLTAQRAYVAPIRQLPAELLSMIFTWCCMDEVIGAARFLPLGLGSVCKLWRDVVQDDPNIWTGLRLPKCPPFYNETGVSMGRATLQRIDRCIRAAKGLPLSQPVLYTTDHADPAPLLVLQKYSSQWQHLVVTNLACDPPDICSLFGGRSYANLHTLEMEAGLFLDPTTNGIFLDTPALRSLTLENLCDAPVLPQLPWANLTELSTATTTEYVLTLLHKCTNLLSWTHHNVVFEGPNEPLGLVAVHAVLPRLRTTVIHDVDATCDTRILEFIQAPALQGLTLSWDLQRTPTPVYTAPYVSAFLARSQCSLLVLSLQAPPTSELGCLHSLPDLRVFRLDWDEGEVQQSQEDLLVALSAVSDSGEPVSLPKLEELELSGYGRYRGESVLKMVEARRLASRPLRALDLDLFHVDMASFGPVDVLERLRALVPDFIGSD
ncbi:hypothetical protein BD626DRAFT_478729 [Schizophyllum amplum]|uniref:F-box domain-containing protein n=1 Tax=Schizophyllum amplum TaxID=97359 RepID=A0A550CRK2_9AGAR|nr:hypothetical protein BD626DRAFT_478729 [Auriculariopsis ampla]